MQPDALHRATAETAAQALPKLATRLSKGEKRNRKRMAEVGSVYDAAPAPRTPADIMPGPDERDHRAPGPTARNKWLVASVVEDVACVVKRIFDEADRRDPRHQRTWVALVDGNNHQIDLIQAEARARRLRVPIVVDFIHVLEYVWKAAWCFFAEGDPKAEQWVRKQALAILGGQAGSPPPSGARPLPNASTVPAGPPKLRALIYNGDFAEYWHYHLDRERLRVHHVRYADGTIPKAA